MYILIFLVIVIGSSLGLYAFRAQGIKSNAIFTWTSREALILVNNLLLVVATGAVLLGTLYPLAYEAVTGGDKLSVGPPYFAIVFVPIVMMLFLFMAISPRSQWKNTTSGFELRRQIIYMVCSLVAVGVLSLIFASFLLPVVLITSIACWITINLVEDVVRRIRNKREKLRAMFSQPMAYYGMLLGHGGIVVSMIGICCTVYFSSEKDIRMVPGDDVSLGGYEFQFVRMRNVSGPNYVADQGEILITHDGEEITRLYPEKRLYSASQSVMTEADMDPGIFRDLYVALGEPVGESAWAVRVHVKPFVRWIWIGGLFVALGGAMAVTDKRYRSLGRRFSNVEISESVA